ncbi:GMC family oxidoreductase [Rubrivivax sp. A210]|uniref:GMC family oxidoreductase n=1 Tax=Rubrivivax sp. A210 TaxID=2772301 RepID=UPI001917B3C7|nr:GMC family oxidoreductase [Rubrivivax sp. A210]CAD5374062.1 GMC family oxidoreductase [Rubrivivax sp. A210]
MSTLPDPIQQGLARGWKVFGGGHAPAADTLDCDVAIVGSGAGAGITAELLARAGLKVVLVEEGPLRSSSHFRQLESDAYPQLYQESASRKTADKAIAILQGRCVGGSTTVNWTSSFRTPSDTLQFWRERFALPELTDDFLSPWFLQAERRLSIGPWLVAPNVNNDLLRLGAARLGIPASAIPRNVKGCWNLGSCGLGCPTNAKQSMLLTTIPAALDLGATLLVQTRAERLEFDGDKAAALVCRPVTINSAPAAGAATKLRARHYVIAGGAINTPGLLLRSKAPDPHGRLGQRSFLHPVVVSTALFDQAIEAWDGAPQTMYTDHFLGVAPIDGPMGYKLEAPPLYPMISAIALPGFGAEQAAALRAFPHTQAVLALLRDGFHPESPGGRVLLGGDGTPVLDYKLNAFTMEGARRALLSMAEIQFAAGARSVTPVHQAARPSTSWAQAKQAISELAMEPYLTRVLSAHQMGGCGMAGKPELGVVRPDGRHWQLANVSVHDGSFFPTSIGANPQLSIYGLVNMLATRLARTLSGREVRLV